jgi:hypothetical protein
MEMKQDKIVLITLSMFLILVLSESLMRVKAGPVEDYAISAEAAVQDILHMRSGNPLGITIEFWWPYSPQDWMEAWLPIP